MRRMLAEQHGDRGYDRHDALQSAAR